MKSMYNNSCDLVASEQSKKHHLNSHWLCILAMTWFLSFPWAGGVLSRYRWKNKTPRRSWNLIRSFCPWDPPGLGVGGFGALVLPFFAYQDGMPIGSMYGTPKCRYIFHRWSIWDVFVTKYGPHGLHGAYHLFRTCCLFWAPTKTSDS